MAAIRRNLGGPFDGVPIGCAEDADHLLVADQPSLFVVKETRMPARS